MLLIIHFFNSIIKNNELIDFLRVIIYLVLTISLIVRYYKYFENFSLQTKITYSLFILSGISIIIGYTNFILKYGFYNDYSLLNNSIADMFSCISLAIFSYGKFKKFTSIYAKPKGILLLTIVLLFFAVITQIRGQGQPDKRYWYWVEYLVCIFSLSLATIWGFKTLRYNWFSRFLHLSICVQLFSTLLMFIGFLMVFPEKTYHPFLGIIGETVAILSVFFILLVYSLVLRIKK